MSPIQPEQQEKVVALQPRFMEEQPSSGEGFSPTPSPEREPNVVWDEYQTRRPGKKRKYPVCQVCSMALRDERPYYQRYRICPRCAARDRTDTDGVLKRFCQQCGKFQAVSLFDGNMKTCRERLDRHAARRRKANAGRGTTTSGPTPHPDFVIPPPTSTPLSVDVSSLFSSHLANESNLGSANPLLLDMLQHLLSNSLAAAAQQHQPQQHQKHQQVVEQRWRDQQHQLLATLTGTPPSPSSITNALHHPVALRFNPTSQHQHQHQAFTQYHEMHGWSGGWNTGQRPHGGGGGGGDAAAVVVDPQAAKVKLEAAIEALQVPTQPPMIMNAWSLAARSLLPPALFAGSSGLTVGGGGVVGAAVGGIDGGNGSQQMHQQLGDVLKTFFTRMSGVDGSSAAQAAAAVPERDQPLPPPPQHQHGMKMEEEGGGSGAAGGQEEEGRRDADVAPLHVQVQTALAGLIAQEKRRREAMATGNAAEGYNNNNNNMGDDKDGDDGGDNHGNMIYDKLN